MKRLLLLGSALLISSASFASHMVSGYVRSNGAYVAPHESMDSGEAKSSGFSYHDNVLVPNNDNGLGTTGLDVTSKKNDNDSGDLNSNSSLNQY